MLYKDDIKYFRDYHKNLNYGKLLLDYMLGRI